MNYHSDLPGRELYKHCVNCKTLFLELADYVLGREKAGGYDALCIDCDPSSMGSVPIVTKKGRAVIKRN